PPERGTAFRPGSRYLDMPLPPSLVRVVVCDDDEMARAWLVAVLDRSAGVSVVGEAADGGQAVHVCMATHPDVVLMDVGMPVVDGIETTRMLVDAHGAAGVP